MDLRSNYGFQRVAPRVLAERALDRLRRGPSRPDFSSDPDFSPDGSRIVYYSIARSRLTVVKADGSGTRRLASTTNAAQQPAWSPNGRMLTWWWSGIYVARADGTHARKIARDQIGPMGSFNFSTYAPSWQPL